MDADEWLTNIVPMLVEKHNETVRLRMALERIRAVLDTDDVAGEVDKIDAIVDAALAGKALPFQGA